MRRGGVVLALALVTLSGCATGGGAPAMTQLQVREYQTRNFENRDAKLVMKAMLNVLQDEGFMIREANAELGLLAGNRELDVEDKGKAFIQKLFHGANARWDKNSIVEVTINISPRGEQTRVRANFQLKTMDNMGAVSRIRAMGDEAYYQEFFAKVDKAIFIETEKL